MSRSEFLFYLFEISAALAVFYGLYRLLLHRETFFAFNRAFILGAVGLSLLLPLVDIPVPFLKASAAPVPIVMLGLSSEMSLPASSPVGQVEDSVDYISWAELAFSLYLSVAALLLCRLLLRLWKLYRLIGSLPAEAHEGHYLIKTGGQLPTFSFFHWLFWDETQLLSGEETEQVMRHEWTHIRQWHTLDILFLELVTVVCWFNPVIYLFKRQLQAVHEYLADREASQNGSRTEYVQLVAAQLRHYVNPALVQPFNQPQLKKRIAMLQKSRPAAPIVWKILASLTGVIVFALLFACSGTTEKEEPVLSPSVASTKLNDVWDVYKQKYPDLQVGGFFETGKRAGQVIVGVGVTVEGVDNAEDEARLRQILERDKLAWIELQKQEGDTTRYVFMKKPFDKVKVSGVVLTRDRQKPLAGCVIMVKGTAGSAITGKDGRFDLNVQSGVSLVFTRVGYAPQEITVNGKDGAEIPLDITLSMDKTVPAEVRARGEEAIAQEMAKRQ